MPTVGDTFYIERNSEDEWWGPACYVVAATLKSWGEHVRPFSGTLILEQVLEPKECRLILGTVRSVLRGLDVLGFQRPPLIDLPAPLQPYVGREVWSTTLQVLRDTEKYDPPIHIKPLRAHKLFSGRVLEKRDQLLDLTNLPGATEILAQACTSFNAEYRVYVQDRTVLGLARYRGNPLLFPNQDAIEKMVAMYHDAPCAYALDVGIDEDGVTRLVEVNDGFALGYYGGISPAEYTHFVLARWAELTNQRRW